MPIRYKFGANAPAYYNAEAVKSQQWRAAAAPLLVTGILGAFQSAAPQYVQPPQPQTFHAVAPTPSVVPAGGYQFGTHATAIYNAESLKSQVWAPAYPPVGVGQLGQFQATQEQPQLFPFASIETPTFSPQGPLISNIQVARQDSPEPFAQVRAPVTAAVATSGVLAKFQYVAEQPNYFVSPSWSMPQPVPLPSVVANAQYTFGTHNQGIYDAEARKIDFFSIPTGGIVAPVVPASTYQFGTHAAAIYNAEAVKSLVWDPALPPSNLQSYIIQIQDERPQDFDTSPRVQHWHSVRTGTPPPTGILGKVQYVQEQPYYITTAWIETPNFNPQGNLIPWLETVRQESPEPFTQFRSIASIPPAPPVPLVRPFVGGPYPYDPTLPAAHWKALRTPPAQQPIVRQFFSPQQADTSANGTVVFTPSVFTGAVIPPPPFFPLPNVVGLYWYHASHVLIENDLFQTLPPKKVFSKVYPPGIVLVQDPPAGTFVLPDTAVLLTVSTREHLVGATFDVIPWWI